MFRSKGIKVADDGTNWTGFTKFWFIYKLKDLFCGKTKKKKKQPLRFVIQSPKNTKSISECVCTDMLTWKSFFWN